MEVEIFTKYPNAEINQQFGIQVWNSEAGSLMKT